ncbi:hypothetical protein AB0I81_41415 [Nonomuraea sp. NPDC050404]|uniref:hypothetical protein n=1 Tax=Nonomuraea sp. NPDC050404 TaxID=3155783 RepID=UPI0034020408
MYGPPPPHEYPEYPRATSSPPIIVLVAGLAALLGFLLGVFVGFGASTTTEPEPRETVTVEESEPPLDPTSPAESSPPVSPPPSVPTQTQPTQPGQTGQPSQPGQTGLPSQPGQTGQPGQPTPPQTGQTGQPGTGGATSPALDLSSMLKTLVVGTDIQPGTYRTTGPSPGFPMCYWARLRTTTDGVIATGMPTGAATVTIQATDKAFQTGGCADWKPA